MIRNNAGIAPLNPAGFGPVEVDGTPDDWQAAFERRQAANRARDAEIMAELAA